MAVTFTGFVIYEHAFLSDSVNSKFAEAVSSIFATSRWWLSGIPVHVSLLDIFLDMDALRSPTLLIAEVGVLYRNS